MKVTFKRMVIRPCTTGDSATYFVAKSPPPKKPIIERGTDKCFMVPVKVLFLITRPYKAYHQSLPISHYQHMAGTKIRPPDQLSA